ncbi:hypothetical protein [uncultured Ruminococcus sp.]|jgi:hypothetical protein|nr:hypothetical protein [uncultured Ruminococcus sp.]
MGKDGVDMNHIGILPTLGTADAVCLQRFSLVKNCPSHAAFFNLAL